MVLAGMCANEYRGWALARPSLSIIWAETWARLLNKIERGKKVWGAWGAVGKVLCRCLMFGSCRKLA